jgi:hypothetical protein
MVKYDCPVCEETLLEIDPDLEENTIGYRLYQDGGRFWCPNCLLHTGKITSYVIQGEDEKEDNEDEDNEHEDE